MSFRRDVDVLVPFIPMPLSDTVNIYHGKCNILPTVDTHVIHMNGDNSTVRVTTLSVGALALEHLHILQSEYPVE